MSVFKKLMNVRTKIAEAGIKKTGWNANAEFWYYELDDFLPKAMTLFNEENLCPVVSFTRELATLTIHSIDDGSKIEITSPFGETQISGCYEIQNIGSSETYSRRYLYLTALELVESDSADATSKKEDGKRADDANKAPAGTPSTEQTQSQGAAAPTDNEDDVNAWLATICKVDDLERLQKAQKNMEDFFKSDAVKKRLNDAFTERFKQLGRTT